MPSPTSRGLTSNKGIGIGLRVVSLPTRIEVVNVVATATLDHSIDLKSLAIHFPAIVSYDPKVYFAAYFKSREMKGKVSIFQSGKMISVGTRSEEEACMHCSAQAKWSAPD